MTLTRRAALGALLAAPAVLRSVRAGAQGAEIVIGCALPTTGAFAASGIQYYNTLRLAQDDINAAGGINGRKLRIAFEDTQASNSFAVNSFIKLVKQGDLPFVFLPSLSTQDLAIEPEVAKAQIPTMYAGGAVAVAERKNPWMFRIRPSDDLQGPAIAYAVQQMLKARKPGLMFTQDDYGTGAANAVEAALNAAGVPLVAKEAFAPRDNDFSAQLLAIQAKGADVLIGFTYNRDGALILSQRQRLGIELPYIGGSATAAPSTLALVQPDELKGVFALADAVLGEAVSPRSADFVQRCTARFNLAPDPYGACYYDGAMMVADALRAVGPDRAKLRDRLAATKDYQGVTRSFTNDAQNNMAHSLTLVAFTPGTKDYKAVGTFPRAST